MAERGLDHVAGAPHPRQALRRRGGVAVGSAWWRVQGRLTACMPAPRSAISRRPLLALGQRRTNSTRPWGTWTCARSWTPLGRSTTSPASSQTCQVALRSVFSPFPLYVTGCAALPDGRGPGHPPHAGGGAGVWGGAPLYRARARPLRSLVPTPGFQRMRDA